MPFTRKRIAAAALTLFTTNGYDGTTMREIADHLQLTPGAFYHHYSSKETLLVELCRPFVEGMERVAEEASAGIAAATIIERYVDMLLDQRVLLQFVSGDPGALRHEQIGPPARAAWDEIVASLARAANESNIKASCAVGAVNGGVIAIGEDDDAEAARDQIVAAAMAVLALNRRRAATPA